MTEITARVIFVERAASHITRWVSWIEKRLAAFLLALARCPPVNLIGACKRQRCMQTPTSRACRFCLLTWCFVAVQRVTVFGLVRASLLRSVLYWSCRWEHRARSPARLVWAPNKECKL